MCAFMLQASNQNIFFSDMRTLHKYILSLFAHNNPSPALFIYLFLTAEIIFFHFCIKIGYSSAVLVIFITQKNAPARAQNGLPDDENPKQGLVGGCPAPLNSCRVNG